MDDGVRLAAVKVYDALKAERGADPDAIELTIYGHPSARQLVDSIRNRITMETGAACFVEDWVLAVAYRKIQVDWQLRERIRDGEPGRLFP